LKLQLKQREAKLRQDKIDNYSLSKELMKQLGIKPKVKYIKSPLKSIKFDFEKNDATESEKLVDWG
jgi:hypothetical protein